MLMGCHLLKAGLTRIRYLKQSSAFNRYANSIFRYNHRLMHQIIQSLNDWYSHALQSGGYPLVALMMVVESSLFPLPSEIVIPPAAHLAAMGQIPLSLWGIVLAGTLGSWFGATLMYWASRLAGRPLVLRFGKYCFISAD